MAISCRMGTLGEGGIQGNSKWKDYHHPPISSQISAQCIYCREGKKKLSLPRSKAGDRICQHCGKEFCYPSNLRQHFLRKNPCAVVESHAQSMQSPCTVEKSHAQCHVTEISMTVLRGMNDGYMLLQGIDNGYM